MEAVIFHSSTVLRFPNLVYFGRKPIFAPKEIADVYPLLSSNKGIRLSVSRIGTDGNAGDAPSRRSSASGRTRKNGTSRETRSDRNKEPADQKAKSNNQEEIIALFRKIQTSISKKDSTSTKEEDSQKARTGAESILDVFRESRKQGKGKSSTKPGDKGLRRKSVPKEREMQQTMPEGGFKLVRPPSKFVKRSPIPSPSSPAVKASQLKDEESQAISESKELKFSSLADMKLSELKALAKSKGMKGYSKLKKNELLELLTSNLSRT